MENKNTDIYYKDCNGNEIFPILAPQSIYAGYNIADKNNMSLSSCLRIKGNLDLDILEKAIQNLYNSYDALRIRIFKDENKYIQKVLSNYKFKLEVISTAGDTNEDRFKFAEKDAIQHIVSYVDALNNLLFYCYLYKIDENDYFLTFVTDHSVFDGASMVVLLNKLFYYYENPDSFELQPSFVEYSKNLAESLKTPKGLKKVEYWNEYLKDFQFLEFPTPNGSQFDNSNNGEVSFEVSNSLLEEFAKQHKTSKATVVMLALNLGIAKQFKMETPYFSTVYASRVTPEQLKMVGPLAKLLLSRFEIKKDETFSEALKRCMKVSSMNIRNAEGCSIVSNIYVTFHNFDMTIKGVETLNIQPVMPKYSHGYNFLVVNYWENSDNIRVIGEFNPKIISATAMQNILSYARQSIDVMMNDITSNVYDFVFNNDTTKSIDDYLEIVKELFEKILDVEQVQNDSSFFELGGNSLKASYLVAELLDKYNIELLISDIYENETVQEIAEFIEKL